MDLPIFEYKPMKAINFRIERFYILANSIRIFSKFAGVQGSMLVYDE